MDAAAAWSATITLRAWERDHLQLEPGQRLLDVGCGLGDAGISLAESAPRCVSSGAGPPTWAVASVTLSKRATSS